ncbi:MAG: histidine ammonia-lyase [Bacteroidales bacterium]|jgi:histidine ammonia-lyase|nr:histidine ammonia-lyase [Bacteroidales bacterium]
MNIHSISNKKLDIDSVKTILQENYLLELSEDAKEKIILCRTYLDNKVAESDEPIYGINTGFGSLYDQSISKKNMSMLQKNLVMSHACGTGDEVPLDIVKLMIFLKIQSLSYGNSGVQLSTVERLIELYNNDVLPQIFQLGSLGASGDLAPLAHLALPLIGMGKVYFENELFDTEDINKKFGWKPIVLQSKEGLALLNGTQFMAAYGTYLLIEAKKYKFLSDFIGAISLDAYDGRIDAFHPKVHEIRAHKGQIDTAKNIRDILEGSEIVNQTKVHVQDPYSFRCIPQVHGATKDALDYVHKVFETEINSATDNPNIFPEDDLIISAGNFHGQPLAIALDVFSIAIAELGSISERRVYRLISGKRGLPSFLVNEPGLNSGFMIPQYTAASIVSQNKQLTVPASTDSISSSQGQEDHVSMGANAATKAFNVMENIKRIIAIELFNSAQALDFRRPLKSSLVVEDFIAAYRRNVDFVTKDKLMYIEIEKSIAFLENLDVEDED